jgi:hypothetical protein
MKPVKEILDQNWKAAFGIAFDLKWQILCYLGGGTSAGILVSLLTRPEDDEKLDRFYALFRTPTEPGERTVAVPPRPAEAPPAETGGRLAVAAAVAPAPAAVAVAAPPREKLHAPCRLPEGTVVPPKRLLFPFGGIEILVPSRRTVVGFLVCAAFVLALVGYVALFIAK